MQPTIPAATVLLAAALALAGPLAAQPATARAGAQPPAALSAAGDAYTAAWNGTDPASVANHFAADAVVLVNGNRMTRADLLEHWIAPNVARVTELRPEAQDVVVDRNRVVESGRFSFRSVVPGTTPQTVHGTYTNIWERQRNGTWKIRSATVNDTPAPGNAAVVRRLFEQAYNQRNFAILDEIVAPDATRYDDATKDPGRGPAMVRAFMQGRIAEMPDLRFTIDEMLAQGDRVVVRWTATGTNRTLDKPVRFHGTSLYRVENGQMVEGRSSVNMLPILQALGYTVTAPVQLAQP